MVTSVTEGRTQKLQKKFKIVETYWCDHSLESSWGALSDGNVPLFDSTFSLQIAGNQEYKGQNKTSDSFYHKSSLNNLHFFGISIKISTFFSFFLKL
jgi:hypothetical protein